MTAFETVITEKPEVACDGGALGHPRVYLHIDSENGIVICPYCSRTFVLRMAAQQSAH